MRKLKKMEQTTINIRIFIEIEICVRESEVMATGERKQCRRCVAVEEGDVGSGFYWIYNRTIVCQR